MGGNYFPPVQAGRQAGQGRHLPNEQRKPTGAEDIYISVVIWVLWEVDVEVEKPFTLPSNCKLCATW